MKLLISLGSLVLLISSCLTVRDISTVNLSSVYRPSEQNFHPEFVAFNESDTTVKLFAKVLPGEFLFIRQPDEKFRAFVNIHSEIIRSYEDTKVLDSTSSEFTFELDERPDYKIITTVIPAKLTGRFLIHCFITDKNKGLRSDYFILIDRESSPSRQDFIVVNEKDIPYFRNYFYQNESVKINHRNNSIRNLYCKYYHREFTLAPPPFSFDVREDFNYVPDSIFVTTMGETRVYPDEGFYHLQIDSGGKDGVTLFRFGNGFPDVTTPNQMIESLRYLTNKREFEEMKNSATPKAMVDNFWLSHGGNEEKTRALIRKYYGRVREANKFFSSHTEGWRTDRGMIYILFGSPGTIYKSNESESWIYGTPNSSLALNFFFIKVNNPFTENDFTLSRSPSYEGSWYRAVEVWRQGRAYNSFY